MNRRHLLAASLVSLSTAALGGCNGTAVTKAEQGSSSTAPSASGATPSAAPAWPAVVGLTYIPNIQFSPCYLATAKGLWDKSVTLRHHGADEGLFTALASGQEQFVVAGGDEMVQARAEGMDLVAIATMYQSYPVRIIVPADSAVTDLAGLKGKSIGVPGKYGENWFALLLALKNAGLGEQDVKVQTIGYTAQAALATKKVDAVVGFTNNDTVQFRHNKVAVREIALGDQVPLVGACLITTRKVLDEHPIEAQQVARGFVEGLRGVVENPSEAITISIPFVPGLDQDAAQLAAKATLEATVPLIKGNGTIEDGTIDGKLDAQLWAEMCAFMADKGLSSKKVDPAAAIDTTVLG